MLFQRANCIAQPPSELFNDDERQLVTLSQNAYDHVNLMLASMLQDAPSLLDFAEAKHIK